MCKLFERIGIYHNPRTNRDEHWKLSPLLQTGEDRADWLSRLQDHISHTPGENLLFDPIIYHELDHCIEVPDKGGWIVQWVGYEGVGLRYIPDETHTPTEIFDIAMAPKIPSENDLRTAETMLLLVSS